jgi:hypothetical protein
LVQRPSAPGKAHDSPLAHALAPQHTPSTQLSPAPHAAPSAQALPVPSSGTHVPVEQ